MHETYASLALKLVPKAEDLNPGIMQYVTLIQVE
jgi:hypothetical protein